MIIACDMDGTLCENFDSSLKEKTPLDWMAHYKTVKPVQEMIDYINDLYDEGNEIYIFTARDDLYTKVTIDWLKRKGVKYNWIQMKKPYYDLLIDDKTVTPQEIITIEKMKKTAPKGE